MNLFSPLSSKSDGSLHLSGRKQVGLARRDDAFTILEALVVIAVIGIVVSLAIVFMNRFHEEVLLEVRNQRNAQEIAALAMGATAVGAQVVAEGDTETTILNLIEGRNGTQGPFKGKVFRLSYLNPDEIRGATSYLNWQGGMICYIKD